MAQNDRLNSAIKAFASTLASTSDATKRCGQLVAAKESINKVLDCAGTPLANLSAGSSAFSRALTSVADERESTPCTEALRSLATSLDAISAGTEPLMSATSTDVFAEELAAFNREFGPGQELDSATTRFQEACSASSSENTQGGDSLDQFIQAMGQQIAVSDKHFSDAQGAASQGDWDAIRSVADTYQQDADAFRQVCAAFKAVEVTSEKQDAQRLGVEWCEATTEKWALLADMTRALAATQSQTYEDAVGQDQVEKQSRLVDDANARATSFQSAYCDAGGKLC